MSRKRSVKDYQFGSRIGEGSYSTVYSAIDLHNRKTYAIKVLSKKHIVKENKIKYVNIEKNTLNLLGNHPGIVQLYYTFQDEASLYFVIDFAEYGELLSIIRKYGSLNEITTKFYMLQIIDAIEFMHSKGVIHRDLKPENILVDHNFNLKITDFGAAKLFNEDVADVARDDEYGDDLDELNGKGSFVGTAEYVSPELLKYNKCGFECDIWAIGCILYQLIIGAPPFKGKTEYLTFEKIISLDYSFPNYFIPSKIKDLISNILIIKPELRLTINQIKKHEFFHTVNWDDKNYIWNRKVPKFEAYNPKVYQTKMASTPAASMTATSAKKDTSARNMNKSQSYQQLHSQIQGLNINSSTFTPANPSSNGIMNSSTSVADLNIIPNGNSSKFRKQAIQQTVNKKLTDNLKLAELKRRDLINATNAAQLASNGALSNSTSANSVRANPNTGTNDVNKPSTTAKSPSTPKNSSPPTPHINSTTTSKSIPSSTAANGSISDDSLNNGNSHSNGNSEPPTTVKKPHPFAANLNFQPIMLPSQPTPVSSPKAPQMKSQPKEQPKAASPPLMAPPKPMKIDTALQPPPKVTKTETSPRIRSSSPISEKSSNKSNGNGASNTLKGLIKSPSISFSSRFGTPKSASSSSSSSPQISRKVRIPPSLNNTNVPGPIMAIFKPGEVILKLDSIVTSEMGHKTKESLDDMVIQEIIDRNRKSLQKNETLSILIITNMARLFIFNNDLLSCSKINLTNKNYSMYDYEFDEDNSSGYLIIEVMKEERLIFLRPYKSDKTFVKFKVNENSQWIDCLLKAKEMLSNTPKKPTPSSTPTQTSQPTFPNLAPNPPSSNITANATLRPKVKKQVSKQININKSNAIADQMYQIKPRVQNKFAAAAASAASANNK